ncbi:MAG: hypothetical protein MJ176_09020 [Treponema sp.]|nr:hypothetical protein [Treponema sp.]
MKKIVSIVAALAMATAMFADPVANVAVVEFTGNAKVTWGVNLDDNKTGFLNETETHMTLQLFENGTKATEGEGVWGEIVVTSDNYSDPQRFRDNDGMRNITPRVDKALLHIGPAWVGILSGDTQVGDMTPVVAVKGSNSWQDTTDVNGRNMKIYNVGKNATQGITIGFQADNIVKVEADIRSNKNADGSKYSDVYATAIQADLLAVPNLTFSVGVAHNLTVGKKSTENSLNDDAFFAKAAYELAINDTFYVKPQAAMSLETPAWEGVAKDSKKINATAAVLFGWNKNENQSWSGVNYLNQWDGAISGDRIKTSNGASVALHVVSQSATDDDNWAFGKTAGDLMIGAFDAGTLVPGLTFGANFEIYDFIYSGKMEDKDGKDMIAETAKALDVSREEYVRLGHYAKKSLVAEAKYSIAVGEGTVAPKAGFGMTDKFVKTTDKGLEEYKFDFNKCFFGVELSGFVPYTTFEVMYDNADLDTTKGTLDVSCKISL